MPNSLIKMPSESAFKKQAEVANEALKTFTAVQNSSSAMVIKAAVSELVDATAEFNNFVPFFVGHALFQEIPPAVFNTLETFANKNPNFVMPSGIARIAGLDARVKDYLALSKNKKAGKVSFLLLFLSNISARRSSPYWTSYGTSWSYEEVSSLHGLFPPFSLSTVFLLLFQTKRPRLSKETVDMSEDDDEQPAKMVKPSATLRPKVSTFSNVADAVNKVSSLLYSLCFSTQHSVI
jgi:hypothetical protein